MCLQKVGQIVGLSAIRCSEFRPSSSRYKTDMFCWPWWIYAVELTCWRSCVVAWTTSRRSCRRYDCPTSVWASRLTVLVTAGTTSPPSGRVYCQLSGPALHHDAVAILHRPLLTQVYVNVCNLIDNSFWLCFIVLYCIVLYCIAALLCEIKNIYNSALT